MTSSSLPVNEAGVLEGPIELLREAREDRAAFGCLLRAYGNYDLVDFPCPEKIPDTLGRIVGDVDPPPPQ